MRPACRGDQLSIAHTGVFVVSIRAPVQGQHRPRRIDRIPGWSVWRAQPLSGCPTRIAAHIDHRFWLASKALEQGERGGVGRQDKLTRGGGS
jgi:hypothetical protein